MSKKSMLPSSIGRNSTPRKRLKTSVSPEKAEGGGAQSIVNGPQDTKPESVQKLTAAKNRAGQGAQKPVVESVQKPVVESVQKPVVESVQKPVVESVQKPVAAAKSGVGQGASKPRSLSAGLRAGHTAKKTFILEVETVNALEDLVLQLKRSHGKHITESFIAQKAIEILLKKKDVSKLLD